MVIDGTPGEGRSPGTTTSGATRTAASSSPPRCSSRRPRRPERSRAPPRARSRRRASATPRRRARGCCVARRLQRAARRRRGRRRHPHPRGAADDRAAARAGRRGRARLPPRPARRAASPTLSMAPVAARLGELLGDRVALRAGCRRRGGRGRGARRSAAARCCCSRTCASSAGETSNDPELAAALARARRGLRQRRLRRRPPRARVDRGRRRATCPAYAGLLLEREVRELTAVRDDPERPLCVVLGGAKVRDKIGVIDRFLERADAILIGGAMATPSSARRASRSATRWSRRRARRWPASVLEGAEDAGCELLLPDRPGARPTLRRRRPRRASSTGSRCPTAGWGSTSGRATRGRYAGGSPSAGTVFWNGPMGVFELEPFAAGTRAVAEAVAAAPGLHRGRRRRLGRGAGARSGSPTRRLALDRRRRVARADGGARAARGGGAAREEA